MKKNIFILLLFFVSLTYSQQTLKVEYKQIYNTASPRTRTAIMQITPSNCIYVSLMQTTKLMKSEQEILNEKESKINDNSTYLSLQVGSTEDDYFLLDMIDKNFKFIDEVGGKKFLIEDDYTINWQITTETKTIANFKTYKAITKFRGRTWEAWFAPDLAYPYGPWKLHGLPGLILEASEESKTYNYVATKIYHDDTTIVFNSKQLPEISFKKFTYLKEENSSNRYNSLLQSRENVKVIKSKTKPQEFDFEWETETPTK